MRPLRVVLHSPTLDQHLSLVEYELAKILGHANIKMTERYAKLAKQHIARTGNTAREMWRMIEKREGEDSERVG